MCVLSRYLVIVFFREASHHHHPSLFLVVSTPVLASVYDAEASLFWSSPFDETK